MRKVLVALLHREQRIGSKLWEQSGSRYPCNPWVKVQYEVHCWIIDRLYDVLDALEGV